MSVFTKQTYLKISIDTGLDLSTATETKILYMTPKKKKGSWVADVNGTVLEYEVQDDDIIIPGVWQLQAYVVIDGQKAYGDIVERNFREPLD